MKVIAFARPARSFLFVSSISLFLAVSLAVSGAQASDDVKNENQREDYSQPSESKAKPVKATAHDYDLSASRSGDAGWSDSEKTR